MPVSKTFDELYNDENGQLQSSITNNENDVATVKAIKAKQIDLKTFDFDGEKHNISDCDAIVLQLEEEIEQQRQRQKARDKESFVFFYNNSNGHRETIKDDYLYYAILYKEFDEYSQIATGVFDIINPFFQGGLRINDINQSISTLKAVHEKKLKEFFMQLLDKKIINNDRDNLADRVSKFNNEDYDYFASDAFRNEEINELSDLTLKVAAELNGRKFSWYKKMLEDQLRFYKEKDSSLA